jgi:hypothetical protein
VHVRKFFLVQSSVDFLLRRTSVEIFLAKTLSHGVVSGDWVGCGVGRFQLGGNVMAAGPNGVAAAIRAGGEIARGRELAGEIMASKPDTKYTLAVNRTTARKIGLILPVALFARADQVIE